MRILDGVNHVLDAVNARLAAPHAFIAPAAEVAHDHCCDGMVAVRVTRIAPRQPPGGAGRAVAPSPNDHISGLLVTVGVQHVRCVEVVDDRGIPPDASAIHADGQAVLADAEKVMQALLCDLDSKYRPRLLVWTPIGPSGGCAGGEWEAQIEFGP